jgi:hypothetical protein
MIDGFFPYLSCHVAAVSKIASVVLYSWHCAMLEMWSLVEISSEVGIHFAQARILGLLRLDAGTIILELSRLSA